LIGEGIISRAEAWQVAQAHVGQDRTITEVVTFGELEESGQRQPSVYMPAEWKPDDLWVAYAGPVMPNALCSSYVVMVSRTTGEVVYSGPANDEG